MIGLDASLARTGMNRDTSLKKLSLLVLSWSQLEVHSLPPVGVRRLQRGHR